MKKKFEKLCQKSQTYGAGYVMQIPKYSLTNHALR